MYATEYAVNDRVLAAALREYEAATPNHPSSFVTTACAHTAPYIERTIDVNFTLIRTKWPVCTAREWREGHAFLAGRRYPS
jgi:hypothetical protein